MGWHVWNVGIITLTRESANHSDIEILASILYVFCLYAIWCYLDLYKSVYNDHTVLSYCHDNAFLLQNIIHMETVLMSEVSGLVHSEGNRSSQHMRVRAGQPIWNEALEGRSNSGHHNSAVVKYFLPSETFWREVLSTSTR